MLISVCTRAPVHAICIIMYVYVGMYVCMADGSVCMVWRHEIIFFAVVGGLVAGLCVASEAL